MEPLFALALLACPVGMGLMMWFMMRGSGGRHASHTGGDSLPGLKAEQARLAEKIDALEQDRTAEVEQARLAEENEALEGDQSAEETTPAEAR